MKLFFTFILFLSSLYAHPHTFIDVYPTIEVKDAKIKSMHFKWVLDEMTSTMLIMDLDKDGNGKIDEKENLFIEKEYFSMFKDYSFYTHIKVNKKTVKFKQPTNFKATIENYRICYSFEIEESYDIKNTLIEFGDTAYYVAMILKDEFLKVNGATVKITKVDSDSYYGYALELK